MPQLIDVLLINPTVILEPQSQDTGFKATYSFQPMSNLVYTRDQQITTCKGIVMGNLRSRQRHMEVDLLSFCFDKLGESGLNPLSCCKQHCIYTSIHCVQLFWLSTPGLVAWLLHQRWMID